MALRTSFSQEGSLFIPVESFETRSFVASIFLHVVISVIFSSYLSAPSLRERNGTMTDNRKYK